MTGKRTDLMVKKSGIGRGGRIRMCRSAFREMFISQGERIIVEFEDNAIMVIAYSDDIVEDGCIRLRRDDLGRLGIREGVTVAVHTIDKTQHSSLGFRQGRII